MIKSLVIVFLVGLFSTSPILADETLVQSPLVPGSSAPTPPTSPTSPTSPTLNAAPELKAEAAVPKTPPVNSSSTPSVSTGAFFGEVMAGLILVLLMIFALAWFVKRMGAGSFLSNQHMKIVASVAMGTRERVVVLDVGGKQVLLGVTPQNINMLHAFDEPVISKTTDDKIPSDFSQKIKYYMQKGPES